MSERWSIFAARGERVLQITAGTGPEGDGPARTVVRSETGIDQVDAERIVAVPTLIEALERIVGGLDRQTGGVTLDRAAVVAIARSALAQAGVR